MLKDDFPNYKTRLTTTPKSLFNKCFVGNYCTWQDTFYIMFLNDGKFFMGNISEIDSFFILDIADRKKYRSYYGYISKYDINKINVKNKYKEEIFTTVDTLYYAQHRSFKTSRRFDAFSFYTKNDSLFITQYYMWPNNREIPFDCTPVSYFAISKKKPKLTIATQW